MESQLLRNRSYVIMQRMPNTQHEIWVTLVRPQIDPDWTPESGLRGVASISWATNSGLSKVTRPCTEFWGCFTRCLVPLINAPSSCWVSEWPSSPALAANIGIIPTWANKQVGNGPDAASHTPHVGLCNGKAAVTSSSLNRNKYNNRCKASKLIAPALTTIWSQIFKMGSWKKNSNAKLLIVLLVFYYFHNYHFDQ